MLTTQDEILRHWKKKKQKQKQKHKKKKKKKQKQNVVSYIDI